MRLPRRPTAPRPAPAFGLASGDAAELTEAAREALEQAPQSDWYGEHGSAADRAAVALCRLRRARAGERGDTVLGDEAVRALLERSDFEAVVWLASRTISYMDENGYPELMEQHGVVVPLGPPDEPLR